MLDAFTSKSVFFWGKEVVKGPLPVFFLGPPVVEASKELWQVSTHEDIYDQPCLSSLVSLEIGWFNC